MVLLFCRGGWFFHSNAINSKMNSTLLRCLLWYRAVQNAQTSSLRSFHWPQVVLSYCFLHKSTTSNSFAYTPIPSCFYAFLTVDMAITILDSLIWSRQQPQSRNINGLAKDVSNYNRDQTDSKVCSAIHLLISISSSLFWCRGEWQTRTPKCLSDWALIRLNP